MSNLTMLFCYRSAIKSVSVSGGSRGHKGLRHFSTKVCEKVEKKGTTTYGEVADELVRELNDPYFSQVGEVRAEPQLYMYFFCSMPSDNFRLAFILYKLTEL